MSPAQLEQHESPKTENRDNQSSYLLDESTPAWLEDARQWAKTLNNKYLLEDSYFVHVCRRVGFQTSCRTADWFPAFNDDLKECCITTNRESRDSRMSPPDGNSKWSLEAVGKGNHGTNKPGGKCNQIVASQLVQPATLGF